MASAANQLLERRANNKREREPGARHCGPQRKYSRALCSNLNPVTEDKKVNTQTDTRSNSRDLVKQTAGNERAHARLCRTTSLLPSLSPLRSPREVVLLRHPHYLLRAALSLPAPSPAQVCTAPYCTDCTLVTGVRYSTVVLGCGCRHGPDDARPLQLRSSPNSLDIDSDVSLLSLESNQGLGIPLSLLYDIHQSVSGSARTDGAYERRRVCFLSRPEGGRGRWSDARRTFDVLSGRPPFNQFYDCSSLIPA